MMRLDFTGPGAQQWRDAGYVSRMEKKYDKPWQREVVLFLKDWFGGKQTFTIHTSGTTGSPRSIKFSRSALLASAKVTLRTFNLKPGDTLLLCLPLKFVAGKLMMVRAIAGKMKLIAEKPASNPLERLGEPVDFAAFTPHQLQNILDENPEKINGVKMAIIGGSPVTAGLNKRIKPYRTAFFETFGMSETLTHIAIRDMKNEDPGMFCILEGFDVSATPEGKLVISAGHLPESPMITSDLVEMIPGNRFRWVGRADDVINSGGIKISPAAIEQKIAKWIAGNFAVGAVKDEKLGEKLTLFIEGNPWPTERKEEIKRLLISNLGKYEQPKEIVFLKHLPRNINGKVIRKKLG